MMRLFSGGCPRDSRLKFIWSQFWAKGQKIKRVACWIKCLNYSISRESLVLSLTSILDRYSGWKGMFSEDLLNNSSVKGLLLYFKFPYFSFSSPEPPGPLNRWSLGTRTRGLWRHRIRKSEILGLLMASICSSRSVNVSKFRCCKPHNPPLETLTLREELMN